MNFLIILPLPLKCCHYSYETLHSGGHILLISYLMMNPMLTHILQILNTIAMVTRVQITYLVY